MPNFASGKFALGICDYCGMQYPLHQLKPTIVMGKRTGYLACKEDWSADHPQNHLAQAIRAQGGDAEALRNPRPERNTDRALVPGPDYFDLLKGI